MGRWNNTPNRARFRRLQCLLGWWHCIRRAPVAGGPWLIVRLVRYRGHPVDRRSSDFGSWVLGKREAENGLGSRDWLGWPGLGWFWGRGWWVQRWGMFGGLRWREERWYGGMSRVHLAIGATNTPASPLAFFPMGTIGARVLWVAGCWVGKFVFVLSCCWTIVQQRGPLGFCSLPAWAGLEFGSSVGPWWPKEYLPINQSSTVRHSDSQSIKHSPAQ